MVTAHITTPLDRSGESVFLNLFGAAKWCFESRATALMQPFDDSRALKAMAKSLIDIYTDELRFLIALKESVSILNNRIHDKLSLIAIEKLRARHPEITFRYGGAGAGGIDILGFASDGTKKLIAEVKTTHTSDTGLRSPQKRAIERDFQRLTNEPGELKRYLVVISEQTKNAVEKQIKPSERFPLVTVIDAIGLVEPVRPEAIEEEE